jgi:VWFA-related protein
MVMGSFPQRVAAEQKIVISTPKNDEIWVDTHAIKAEILGIKPANISRVEFYINGKLMKEFTKPPYLMTYDFGPKMLFQQIKIVAHSVDGQVIEKAIHSLYVDDYQEVRVRQIMVPVVVINRQGQYIKDLKKEDFVLEVDNQPQSISYFSTSGKSTFHLILLIDISSSMKDKIGDVKEVAKQFLKNLLSKNDRAKVVFFNHEVSEDTDFTSDMTMLNNSISMAFPFGATALYDAILFCYRILMPIQGHKIIILFSDGEDNTSHIDPYTIIKRAEKSNVTVYTIGKRLTINDNQYETLLEKIASSSGGLTFMLDSIRQIERVYREIRTDIKSQYMLYFSPKNIKKARRFHTLKVSIKNKKSYRIRTLKGFFY